MKELSDIQNEIWDCECNNFTNTVKEIAKWHIAKQIKLLEDIKSNTPEPVTESHGFNEGCKYFHGLLNKELNKLKELRE